MPFVLGWNALFGRTDKVPGLLFVGTSFFYFCFIPLIPLGSYIVRYEDDDWFGGFKGVPIGFSFKSVLYGWGRVAAVLAIAYTLFHFYFAYFSYHPGISTIWGPNATHWSISPGWSGVLTIFLSLLAFWVMHVTSRASARWSWRGEPDRRLSSRAKRRPSGANEMLGGARILLKSLFIGPVNWRLALLASIVALGGAMSEVIPSRRSRRRLSASC
jgi:hypothetical protein